MADISNLIENIRDVVMGKDMRGYAHNAIQKMNEYNVGSDGLDATIKSIIKKCQELTVTSESVTKRVNDANTLLTANSRRYDDITNTKNDIGESLDEINRLMILRENEISDCMVDVGKLNDNNEKLKKAVLETTRLNNENVELVDKLEEDISGRNYIQCTGSDITVKNSHRGITKDLSVVGKTWNNCVIDGQTVRTIDKSVSADSRIQVLSLKCEIPANVDSLLVFRVVSKSAGIGTVGNKIKVAVQHPDGSASNYKELIDNAMVCMTVFKGGSKPYNRIWIYLDGGAFDNGAKLSVNNVMLFYDVSDFDYKTPYNFIDGMRSTGDTNNLVKIKSTNKNILKNNEWEYLAIDGTARDLVNKVINHNTVRIYRDYGRFPMVVKVYLNKNTNYKFLCEETPFNHTFPIAIRVYNTDNINMSTVTSGGWFSVPYDGFYTIGMRIAGKDGNTDKYTDVSNARIIQDSDNSDYNTHVEDVINMPVDQGLRSLPNGVADSVFVNNDGLVILERNVGKKVLDGTGTMNISSMPNQQDTITAWMPNNEMGSSWNDRKNLVCDKFPSTGEVWNKDRESIAARDGDLYLRIKRSRLTTQDIAGVRQWLSANPVTVLYRMNQKQYYVIEELNDVNLISYDETSHFLVDDMVQGTLSLKAPIVKTSTLSSMMIDSATQANIQYAVVNSVEVEKVKMGTNELKQLESSLDLDYRLMLLEENHDTKQPSNLNTYDLLYKVIVYADYNVDDVIVKVDNYHSYGRITEDEYNSLMNILQGGVC